MFHGRIGRWEGKVVGKIRSDIVFGSSVVKTSVVVDVDVELFIEVVVVVVALCHDVVEEGRYHDVVVDSVDD